MIIGVGDTGSRYGEIYKSYEAAAASIRTGKLYHRTGVIEYKHNEKREDIGFDSISGDTRIMTALRNHDFQKVTEELEKVKTYLMKKALSYESVYAILLSLVTGCLSYMKEMGIDSADILGADFYPVTEIKNKQSIDEAFVWMTELFRKVIESIGKSKVTRTKIIAGEVQNYIDKHYADLTLRVESIAKDLYLDSSYIRKALAKEMNISVSELIKERRMEKVRDILLHEKIKFSAVAERLGYKDPKYFGV